MKTFKKKNMTQPAFEKSPISKIEEIIEEARNGRMFVLADEVNSVYMQPFTGAVAIDDVN